MWVSFQELWILSRNWSSVKTRIIWVVDYSWTEHSGRVGRSFVCLGKHEIGLGSEALVERSRQISLVRLAGLRCQEGGNANSKWEAFYMSQSFFLPYLMEYLSFGFTDTTQQVSELCRWDSGQRWSGCLIKRQASNSKSFSLFFPLPVKLLLMHYSASSFRPLLSPLLNRSLCLMADEVQRQGEAFPPSGEGEKPQTRKLQTEHKEHKEHAQGQKQI